MGGGGVSRGGDRSGAAASRPGVVLGDLTLVRPLAWTGVPVIVVSTEADDVAFRSRYVVDRLVVRGYAGAVQQETAVALAALGARLAAEHGGKIPLFYGNDKQLELIFRHRELLAAHFVFLTNDEEIGWALLDKERFAALCARTGVLAPRTVVPGGEEDEEAILSLRTPLLVKPRTKVDWKETQRLLFTGTSKARLFSSAEELLSHPAYPRVRDRILVQEAIESPVTDLVSFHGFAARDGRLLGSFCGRKLRTFPRFAGESALIELVQSAEIEAAGRDVVARLGLKGPFKVDFVHDPRTGAYYTLEVNARFNLWDHLGAADGVNLLGIAYDYLVHGRAPETLPACLPRTRWVSLYRAVRAVRESGEGIRGAFGWARDLLPRRRLVHETFDWKDPMPFLSFVGGAIAGKVQGLRWRFSA